MSKVKDFFPCYASEREMWYIRNNFGNDGYAVWSILLEELSKEANNLIEMNHMNLTLLASESLVSEEKLMQVIEALIQLGKFDSDLWRKNNILYAYRFEKTERPREKGMVYLIKSKFGYKIGRTKNLTSRVKLFGVKLPFKIELVQEVQVKDYKYVEKRLHEHFASKHLNGEWFDLSTRDVAEFKQLAQQFDNP